MPALVTGSVRVITTCPSELISCTETDLLTSASGISKVKLRCAGLGNSITCAAAKPMRVAVAVPLPAPAKATVIQSPPAEDTRPLVLVVDDHADMCAYVASCLAGSYRIATASEGHEGLRRITKLGPTLVVPDVMMPGLNGLELCRRVKTDERSSHIPVVLLTARASDQGKLDGLTLGADDYLTKTFRPAELQARVANLIRQRQQLRERFSREVTLQPHDISITSAAEAFLTRVMAVVEQHLAEPEFDVESFAAELYVTRVHLYRKLKALTDQTPTGFVRTLRLRRAAQLLEAQAGSVADVAYQVGFINLSYFMLPRAVWPRTIGARRQRRKSVGRAGPLPAGWLRTSRFRGYIGRGQVLFAPCLTQEALTK